MPVKKNAKVVRCDFCGRPGAVANDFGLNICEPCRMREAIENAIARADGVIEGELPDNLRREWELAQTLSQGKDRKIAEEVLRAAYNLANAVNVALTVRPEAMTGRKVRAPFEDANLIRRELSARDKAEWQARAEQLWAQPQHAGKSKSDIARLIDRSQWDLIRRKIERP